MKWYALVLGCYGLMIGSAHADDHFTFVTKVFQAVMAKTQCPSTGIVYEDWVARAAEMHLPPEIVEHTRLAIAYSLTNGQLGEAQNRELMAQVSIAGKMIDIDQTTFGLPEWCVGRREKLVPRHSDYDSLDVTG
jgi:hypothetical protein